VAPLTYNEEQEQLKKSVIAQMHAAAEASDANSEDDFMVAKEKPKRDATEPVLDVEIADRDPEVFLSNVMASRAWTQQDDRDLHPFESDDDDEERRADEFEEAYNLRFEDPAKSNEKLQSHARDLATKYSVRREEDNPRQRKREVEKAAKAAAKQQLKEEKARLRKLKVEEVEEKVRKIKEAAGLRATDLQPQDWQHVLNEDWDDSKWDEEMQKRFGEKYYADEDALSNDDEATGSQSKKPKKPKFDDDIDINDIVPDYKDEDEQPELSLSDAEAEVQPKKESKRKAREDKKRSEKRERRIIEQLVDDQLQMELDQTVAQSKKSKAGFRYRETSPKTFGLTAKDILLADDAALNEFAGLKKLAAFRDPERKRKDQKHLGKKARLRKWRKDVFGDEEGPALQQTAPVEDNAADEEDGGVNIIEGEAKKKKKRRKSKKQKTVEA
jgi:protein KRI1